MIVRITASVIMENAGAMWDSLVLIVLRKSVLEIAAIMDRVIMKVESAFAMKVFLGVFVK